jgi:hypothetical protein
MDIKFCKHVLNLLIYYKINSNRYTYMRKDRDISPQTTISLVFGGSIETNSANFERKFLRV